MLKFIKASVQISVKSILIFSLLASMICMVVFDAKYPGQFAFADIVWFVPGLLLCFGLYKLWLFLLTKSHRFTVVFLSVLSVVLYAISLFSFDTQPVSDYRMIWKAAIKMADGSFNIHQLKGYEYLAVYTWQTGMAVLESLFIRIFGANFDVLKVVSVVCSLLISYLVYVVSKAKAGVEAAKAAYVLVSVFTPYIMAVNQLSNHQVGTIFLLLSFYHLQQRNYINSFWGGVFAALLNVFRAIAIIVILAAVCMSFYRMIKNGKIVEECKKLGLTLAGFGATSFVFSALFLNLNYIDAPLSTSKLPYYKFHKGLVQYKEPFTDLKRFDGDQQAFNAWEKAEVEKVISDKKTVSIFIANKMVRFLGLFDGQFEHTYNQDEKIWQQQPIRAFYSMGWMQYLIYVSLAFIGYHWRQKRNGLDVFQIWFVGNTLVYLFIEAISHYRFEHYIFLFVMGGVGFVVIRDRLAKKNPPLPADSDSVIANQ